MKRKTKKRKNDSYTILLRYPKRMEDKDKKYNIFKGNEIIFETNLKYEFLMRLSLMGLGMKKGAWYDKYRVRHFLTKRYGSWDIVGKAYKLKKIPLRKKKNTV